MRDVAGAIQRYHTHPFDKVIYVVGDQQDLHLAQFFKILELMGEPFAVTLGMLEQVKFAKVLGMRGEVKFLESGHDEGEHVGADAHERGQVRACGGPREDERRDWDDVRQDTKHVIQAGYLPFLRPQAHDLVERDTGAYLQYAHVRMCSVTRKVKEKGGVEVRQDKEKIGVRLLKEPEAREIVYLLTTYSNVRMTF